MVPDVLQLSDMTHLLVPWNMAKGTGCGTTLSDVFKVRSYTCASWRCDLLGYHPPAYDYSARSSGVR